MNVSCSRELQIGKAAEHLVCADLLLQGYEAYLADQGVAYDVIADVGGRLVKIQVKATTSPRRSSLIRGDIKDLYVYSNRRAKRGARVIEPGIADFFAFVALDRKLIAYVPVGLIVGKSGHVKQCLEFRTRQIQYQGAIYRNGMQRPAGGKFFEDFAKLPPGQGGDDGLSRR